jgi:hypothetical protein
MCDVIRSVSIWTFSLAAACTCEQSFEPAPSTTAAAAAPAAGAAAGDAAPSPSASAGQPLSEEDLRIINADPATLTPEERRKRPFALRRKIMQNPDSPAAKSLEDLRKAVEAGEIEPPAGLIKFEARGATEALPPAGGPPPAGSRPPETPSAQ